jgi:Ca2+/Na+ antiporter
MFGCAIGLPASITAITFVALGTSLPDTFASRQAAMESPHADAAIGNVTGSNCVNVFLGLGLPWVIGACYYSSKVITIIKSKGRKILKSSWRPWILSFPISSFFNNSHCHTHV